MTAPAPTALKRLRGTYRPDRAHSEPQPASTRPQCPRWLTGDARRAWRRLAPVLHRSGLLTQADRNALARYCQLWSRYLSAEQHLQEHGSIHKLPSGYVAQSPYVSISAKLAALLSRLESDFGMSPSARTRIDVAPPREPLNELEQLIGRGRANRGIAGKIEPPA